jgi:hypothetical protein
LSPCYCKRARSTRNEARQVKRGAYGRMRQPADIRLFGGRSFMGTGKKTTFIMTNVRPKGRPHAPVQKPHRWLPCGAFDSVVGGREGPLPMELYLLHPAFCLYYQKPSPPVLSCPSRTPSKASAPAPPPWFLGRAGTRNRAGQLPAYQLRKLQSRQQFTA